MAPSEVFPGVHAIPLGPTPPGGASPPPQAYLVTGRDGSALIDAGHGDDERLSLVRTAVSSLTAARPLRFILLTDWYGEHTGGAPALKAQTGATVAAGRDDVARIHRELGRHQVVDTPLAGGEAFDLGGRRILAVAAPGHTPGATCYLIQGEGVLFSGDCVLSSGTTAVRPTDGGDMAAFVATLRKLQTLDLRLLLSFHGPPVADPAARIAELVRLREERDAQVLDALRAGLMDVDAIRDRLYRGRDLSERQWAAAREQVLAHLLKLEKEAGVRRVEPGQTYRLP